MTSWRTLTLEPLLAVRRKAISRHLLAWFRQQIPPMSQTETIALQAGTVGWDAELYRGRPDWQALANTRSPPLTRAERAFLDGPVEELCEMVDDWEITERRADLPPAVWAYLREKGFFGLIIPKQYGGLGFSALAHSAVVMKVASRSLSTAVTLMVPNSLGPAELLLRYGTDAQRTEYLPKLASGEQLPCFALTGPHAGSDAASLPDSGELVYAQYQGHKVLGIQLNWDKRYITLAPVATLIGLAFTLRDPRHLIGDREELGITLALIPATAPGVTIGRRHYPARQGFQNGPTQGREVFAPLDWVIGAERGIGQGWRMLMECLATGRAISLPSISSAAVQCSARNVGAYARIRRQFHTPIANFEGVQEPLARIAADAYAVEALRDTTAALVGLGQRPSVLSAIAKERCTERMRHAVNDAMDVFAGRGIVDGPSNPIFRHYLAVPIGITVEGSNILTRSLMVFGQGALRCHPWLLKEVAAAREPDPTRAVHNFDHALFGHLRYFAANIGRTLWYGLGGGRWQSPGLQRPADQTLAGLQRRLSRMATGFALTTDVALLTVGGALKRREHLSARLADIVGELYTAGCVLRRFEQQGRCRSDLALVRWNLETGLQRCQTQMRALLANLPQRTVAWLLGRLLFPWGDWAKPPTDALQQELAGLLSVPSAARDRLTAGIYRSGGADDPSGRLDRALDRVAATAASERRIQAALRAGRLGPAGGRPHRDLIQRAWRSGIIDPGEAAALRAAARACERAIAVDDFAPSELRRQRPAALNSTGRRTKRPTSATLMAKAC